jgi:hypothetical protein
MNAKAKRLTLSDLTKYVVFQKMSDSGKDDSEIKDLEESWDNSEKQVNDFSNFIWHVWVSSQNSCPKKEIYREMDKHFKSLNKEDAKRYIYQTILYEVNWYHEYENPDEIEDSKNREIRKKYLAMLKSMGASRCYPLLLSIDYCENNKLLNTSESNELLKKIVSLTFWYSGICENDAKSLESLYHELAFELRRKTTTETSRKFLENTMKRLSEVFPSRERCFGTFFVKNFEDESFTKMILRSIENERSKEKELKSNSIVWLEHILPQNPKEDGEWIKIFNEPEIREDLCTRFGNLTLLYGLDNIDVSNKDFGQKIKEYIHSDMYITKDIANDYKEWNEKNIRERTEKLSLIVEKIWPIG